MNADATHGRAQTPPADPAPSPTLISATGRRERLLAKETIAAGERRRYQLLNDDGRHKEANMRIDIYTRAALTIIALATTALALRPLPAGVAHIAKMAAPTEAAAADSDTRLAETMAALAKDVDAIGHDLNQLVRGYCRNKKLCGS